MAVKIFEGLNEQQSQFILRYLEHGDKAQAALEAGYAHGNTAWLILRLPAAFSAIRNEISRRIVMEGAPLGYRVLSELAKNPDTPPAVRRACSRDLIDRAGHVAPKALGQDPKDAKPLHEMSSDELRAVVDRLESELAARATVVSAPYDTLQIAKPLNWLD